MIHKMKPICLIKKRCIFAGMNSYKITLCLLTSVLVFFAFGMHSVNAENIKDFTDKHASGIYGQHALMSNADLYVLASHADSIGNKNKAIALYTLIMGRSKNTDGKDDKLICAKAANATGIIYFNFYNYSKALKMFLQARDICKQIGDEDFRISIGNNIGVLYSTFQEYSSALEYFEEFYENHYKNDRYREAAYALNNIISSAVVAQDTVAINKYLKYTFEECFSANEVVTYTKSIGSAFVALERKDYASALVHSKLALKLSYAYDSNELFKRRMLCSALQYLGLSYIGLKQYDSATYYMNLTDEKARNFGFKDVLCVNYRYFAKLAKERGLFKDYGNYMEQYVSVADSLYSTKEYGSFKDVMYGHKLEQTENEIYRLQDLQKINNRMIKLQRNSLRGVLFALILISIFVLLLWRQKKKLYESYLIVYQKNKEIMKAEDVKDREFQRNIDFLTSNSLENTTLLSGEGETLTERYSTSSLKTEHKKMLISNILALMNMDKVYVDQDLTLESFSVLLQSNTKYVSQVINEYFKKNFTTFINEYRVKAACKLFENPDYKKYTIEALGQKVGFKSRNNFNQVFKKQIGISPSQYSKLCSNS